MKKKEVLQVIAENLRKHMFEKKMSVLELSRVCQVSAGTISKIMNCKMSVTIPIAMSIAEGLNVSLDDLLLGLSDKSKNLKYKDKLDKEQLYVGILSINHQRIACIKNARNEIIGKSQLNGGLDLAETSFHLHSLIEESISHALKDVANYSEKVEIEHLNLVTQSYEFEDSRVRFINFARKHFKNVQLFPDWQITYFSDFQNCSGISLITDKGVSLSYKVKNELHKLGGWKFPVYDLGGVNWLGMEVLQHTIDAVEGTVPMTPLASSIISKYSGKIERMTEICFKGNKDHDVFSEFAHPLLNAYFNQDPTAKSILDRGFSFIERLIQNVDRKLGSPLPIAIHGSLAPIYSKYFHPARLVTPSTDIQKADLLASFNSLPNN